MNGRRVALDEVEHDGNEFTVSTVRLAVSHGSEGNQDYETAVDFDGFQVVRRYEGRHGAHVGHQVVVGALRSGRYELVPTGYRLELETIAADELGIASCGSSEDDER